MFACGPTLLCPASPVIGGADPFFSFVTMLLHFDGADGSQAFVDVKGNSFTMTGAPRLRTAQAKFGTSSLYFDQVDHTALKLPNKNLCKFLGDFTIEGWIYPMNPQGGTVIEVGGVANVNWQPLQINMNGNNIQIAASSANTGTDIASFANFGTVSLNTWHHFAVSKDAKSYRCFLDGILGLTINNPANPFVPEFGVAIGNYPVGDFDTYPNNFTNNAYYDEFRITNGVARYTSNFAVPTAPFPNF